jgi:hypothetical protein
MCRDAVRKATQAQAIADRRPAVIPTIRQTSARFLAKSADPDSARRIRTRRATNIILGCQSKCSSQAKPHIPLDGPMIVLGLAFAASWAVVTVMQLLEAAGGCPGGRSGHAHRSLSGRGSAPRGELHEALSPDDVGAAVRCTASH